MRIRVLVTGGAGFIGGHIAEQFAASGHGVTILDEFVPYYDLGIKRHDVEAVRQAAEESGGSCTLVEDTCTDEGLVNDLVADTDLVY